MISLMCDLKNELKEPFIKKKSFKMSFLKDFFFFRAINKVGNLYYLKIPCVVKDLQPYVFIRYCCCRRRSINMPWEHLYSNPLVLSWDENLISCKDKQRENYI